jgi:hypothetical protein
MLLGGWRKAPLTWRWHVRRYGVRTHVGFDARHTLALRLDGGWMLSLSFCRPRPFLGLHVLLEAACAAPLRRVRRCLPCSRRACRLDALAARPRVDAPTTCGFHLWLFCAPEHKAYTMDFHGVHVMRFPELDGALDVSPSPLVESTGPVRDIYVKVNRA